MAVAPLGRDAVIDERLLAWLRVGASSLLAIRLFSDSGPGHSSAVQALAAVNVCYALLVLLVSGWRPEWQARQVNTTHAIDFAWTTVASTISGGPGSHAFTYFAFVLGAASFHGGLKRTLLNGLLVIAVALVQTAAVAVGVTPWALEFDGHLFPISSLVFAITVQFGILADRLHRARHQAAAIAMLVGRISHATRLSEALSTTLVAITRLMEARRVTVVVKDTHTGTVTVWQAASHSGLVTTSHTDLPHDGVAEWVAPCTRALPPCEFRRRHPDAVPLTATSLATAADGPATWQSLARGVLADPSWHTLLATPLSVSDAWMGQLYVMDSAARPRGEIRLRFLADIVQHVTPGLLSLYFLRRLRSRAGSLERGRISRELHDTVNQSLAGLDMRLEVVRRHAGLEPRMAEEVAEIQALLRAQSAELRQLGQRLRHDDLDARRLPAAIEDLVERFAHQGDIDARLDWAVEDVALPPQRCTELARIVQEALFNVRRHSGATRVLVRVAADADGWTVIVEDNGRGLGFTGRLAGESLDFLPQTPRVIRDRSAALGGSLAIESSDRGTRLEIAFPTDGGPT